MRARRPHYFLRTQAAAPPAPPRWAFSLQAGDQSPPITAGDLEPNASWERLQLLTVVRGLEALPEPALVTLATASDVVRRGIRHGLEEWREMGWQLELFGELIPVKNVDLWKRIDRALAIHDVQIRNVRVDEPIIAEQAEQPHFAQETTKLRRGQAALVGSGKLSRASENSHDHSDHGSTGSPETTTRHNPWDTASEWHDADDGEDFDSHDESHTDTPAQQAGNARSKRPGIKNAPAIQKRAADRNSAAQQRPGYSFSLLRVRRRIRASRLQLQRRLGELWSSWIWFYEVSGLPQVTRSRKPLPPPWLRDQQQREQPHRY
jgi:ribonuclease HI